ncbi:MAG: general secretion pathway protein GspK [Candidatus Omnitrophica bacterium]|nr:general secretion pathway protein GspK [Candidatus Omnitrophota bacterium]
MDNKGAILIVTSWILAILTLFAVGVGFRTGLEIKLTGYNLDKVKTLYIAKAGIRRAVIEKWKEYAEGRSLNIDSYAEDWGNIEEYFKEVKFGGGSFELSFYHPDFADSKRGILLYGLEDESGRININSDKGVKVFKNLLLNFGFDLKEAEDIAGSIKDWRDEDNVAQSVGEEASGAEDAYYQSLEEPYSTRGEEFKALEEILLVKGVTDKLFYGGDRDGDGVIGKGEHGLINLLTVYGAGKININTAPREVLDGAFGIGYSDLASKVVDYRNGMDGDFGTSDDRWFTMGDIIVERGTKGLVEVKDLNDESWYGNIFGITNIEYTRIRDLITKEGLLSTSSGVYRANVTATVDKVRKVVTAVISFNAPLQVENRGFSEEIPPPDIEYLYWHEER